MLPAGTLSIDNGTKSVTYNAPINRGENSPGHFLFSSFFSRFLPRVAIERRARESGEERGKILGWSRGTDPALKSREGNSTAAHLCSEVWAFLPVQLQKEDDVDVETRVQQSDFGGGLC